MISSAVSDCLVLPVGTLMLPPGTLSPGGLLAFFSPGYPEMMVVAMVALLLYGGKLPEVARSWGKTFAEFRRGLTGLQNDFKDVIYTEHEQLEYRDDSQNSNGYDDEEEYFDETEATVDDADNDADNDGVSNDDAKNDDNSTEHLESNRKDDNLNDALQQDPHLAALNQTGNTVTDASAQTIVIDAAEANTASDDHDDTPINSEEKPPSET